MSFIQIVIHIDSKNADILSDMFLDLGALSSSIEDQFEGTEFEQSIYTEPELPEPILWNHSKLVILFDNKTNIEEVMSTAKSVSGISFTYNKSILSEQDWVLLTQSQFNPIEINSKLYIVPSWHIAPNPNAVNITLDPGVAFGTGSHATTSMCLNWISNNINSNTKSLLDYGCGSGILAITAKKFNANYVVGIDIESQAIDASIINAKNNIVDIQFGMPSILQENYKTFEVVIANILSNPLRVLAPNLAHLTQKTLILSGILEDQAFELCEIYSHWFNVNIEDNSADGWVLLRCDKK